VDENERVRRFVLHAAEIVCWWRRRESNPRP
jgi:hypothetical protein